ncbi:MAG: hypothetical protein WCN88_03900 [Candidatus Falkowbacteria bacterium]
MESEEEKKKFLMKVGIISLMVLILIFWVLNIKNVFRYNAEVDAGQSNEQWKSIRADFNDTIDKMSSSLAEIEATNARLKAASSSLVNELILAASSSDMVIDSSSIPAVTDSVTSTTPTPTPTPIASSSPSEIKKDCPPYIDCMPTIGEAKPCEIPVGCEGITQIAY